MIFSHNKTIIGKNTTILENLLNYYKYDRRINHNKTDLYFPIIEKFITIPGCVDIAIKGNILYSDNAIDLVAIDISSGAVNLEVVKRIKDVFPEHKPPDGKSLQQEFLKGNRPENTLIIGWELY